MPDPQPDLFGSSADSAESAPPAGTASSDAPRVGKPPDASAAFARHLYGLSAQAKEGTGDARGSLARLRRSLGRRGVDPAASAEVGGALPPLPQDPDEAERALDAHLWVAALYAVHAQKMDTPWFGGYVAKGASFGASCERLRRSSASVDRRFAALLDARWPDLPYRLRQAVTLLAASEVGVDYGRLLRDLLSWDAPGRPVQRQWSLDYWAPRSPSPSNR